MNTEKSQIARRKSDGNKVFIDDVPNGKKCGCICSKCHESLIATNSGEINIHAFSPYSSFDFALHSIMGHVFPQLQNDWVNKDIPFHRFGVHLMIFVPMDENLRNNHNWAHIHKNYLLVHDE